MSAQEKAYYDEFLYEGDGSLTIADYLTELNLSEVLKNTEGKVCRKVVWECSCKEGKCGACAMVINGIPALACTVFLKDIQKRGKITLEPLHKFPLIRDLKVDRQCIFDALKKRKVWLEKKKTSDFSWDYQLQYQSSKCLMCGCCLEACPNFSPGHTFEGAPLMVHLYKEIEQNEEGTHKTEMKEAYRKHFFRGCGNAMACKNVCPAKIALDDIQARINHYQEG